MSNDSGIGEVMNNLQKSLTQEPEGVDKEPAPVTQPSLFDRLQDNMALTIHRMTVEQLQHMCSEMVERNPHIIAARMAEWALMRLNK
jgi:hypothetical protein